MSLSYCSSPDGAGRVSIEEMLHCCVVLESPAIDGMALSMPWLTTEHQQCVTTVGLLPFPELFSLTKLPTIVLPVIVLAH